MSEKKICTLMYHDVYDKSIKESGFNFESNYPYKLDKTAFEDQVKTFSAYINKNGIDKDYLRLSFDDGGVSFYTQIMPILEKYGFKGYFFIATSFIGQDGFLTEQMIKEMHNRGHIIGGHSHTHRQRMHTFSYDELKADWKNCIETLDGIIGEHISVVSLPNGFESKKIYEVLQSLGVKDIYTSEPFEKTRFFSDMNVYGRYGIRDSMTVNDVLAITFDKKTKCKIRIKKECLNFLKKVMGNSYITIREKVFKARNS